MSNITIKNGKPTSINIITEPKNRISINTKGGVPGTGGGGGATRLVDLLDVNARNAANNNTLVYDEVSGKYVVEILPIIDAGEF